MTSKRKEPTKKQLSEAAKIIGRLGGLSRSKNKKMAAAINGQLGGRPKKGTK